MPAAKRGSQVLVYDDFSGGDFGVLAGFRAPSNTYSGTDVQAFLDGSVGPRCGVTPIASPSMPVGKVAGMGFFGSDAGTEVPWFVIGTSVYASVTAPVALTGTLGSAPTLPVQGVAVGNKVYISNYGDKVYELTTTTASPVAALASGGKCIVGYGDRLLAANFPGEANRVRYSDGNDFLTWGALNFFDVGQGGQIVGMWTVRQNVYIAKNDGTWWVYSGVPGSGSDVLRLAYQGLNYPADHRSAAVVGGSNVWYVAQGEHFPSYFNGSNVFAVAEQDTLERLYSTVASGVESKVCVIGLSRRTDLLVLAGKGLTDPNRVSLLLRDGKWSRHSVDGVIGAAVPGTSRVLLCDGGDASVAPVFSWWLPTGLERPGLDGTYDAVTDNHLTASVELREHVDPDGRDLKVQKVIVNMKRFDQAGYSNHLECSITKTRAGSEGPDVTGRSKVFDQSSAFGSETGEPHRAVFRGIEQGLGTGFIVRLNAIRGVAVQSVWVYYEAGGVRV